MEKEMAYLIDEPTATSVTATAQVEVCAKPVGRDWQYSDGGTYVPLDIVLEPAGLSTDEREAVVHEVIAKAIAMSGITEGDVAFIDMQTSAECDLTMADGRNYFDVDPERAEIVCMVLGRERRRMEETALGWRSPPETARDDGIRDRRRARPDGRQQGA